MNGIKFHEGLFIENSQMETHGCFVKSSKTSNNVCLDVLPNSIHLFCMSTFQDHIVQMPNFQVCILVTNSTSPIQHCQLNIIL
jgi:hypothetical protein